MDFELPQQHRYHAHSPRPLRLSHVFLSLGIELVALAIPLPRRIQQFVVLPSIFAIHGVMLRSGSPSVVVSYLIGTAIAFHGLHLLDVFVWRGFEGLERLNVSKLAEEEGRAAKEGREVDVGRIKGEPYPADKPFFERFKWCWDFVASPRAVGFSGEDTGGVQDPPELVANTRKFVLHRLWVGLCCYLALDGLTYYMRILDGGYFLPIYAPGSSIGQLPSNPPPPAFLAPILRFIGPLSPLALHLLRSTFQALAIYIVITGLYTLVALLFILLHSPSRPRTRWAHPRSWPPLFPPPTLTHGLAGFWSRSWHSLFRRVFTAPGDALGLGTVGRSLTAFISSAVLHWAGGWSNSRRGGDAFTFFVAQVPGIMIEALAATLLRRAGVLPENKNSSKTGRSPTPTWWKVIRTLWAAAYLGWSSSWFFDEYRSGGLWTCEPVPWSLWRGGQWVWGKSLKEYGIVW